MPYLTGMNNIKLLTAVILLFSTGNIFAAGNKEVTPGNEGAIFSPSQNVEPPPAQQASRAEQVMKALAAAYPLQIDRVEFRNGDWAVLLRGVWYYYSGGRLLPDYLLTSASDYSLHGFYNYQAELPEWRVPGAEEQERLRNMSAARNQVQIRRSPHFFDNLWRARNRNEAYDRVKSMRFLGKPVTVHFMIMENLSLVEETILAAAKTDSQVQTWLSSISEIAGWQWRNIADTESRSYHAYGLAVDITPRSFGGRETYWLWTQRHKADWWNVPYRSRYHPPPAVVKAFEKYGFIWGGKWLFYDTMHFEYRPEILILAGMPPETRR
jgi:hypothetical protein